MTATSNARRTGFVAAVLCTALLAGAPTGIPRAATASAATGPSAATTATRAGAATMTDGAVTGTMGTVAAAPGVLPALGLVTRETGVVRGIADGDTFYLNVQQPAARIRLSGIQTTEIAHRGIGRTWCHGLEAKYRLSLLMMNRRVALRSLYASYATDGRRLRYAYVWNGRTYVDAQYIMLTQGHALWHPSAQEWLNNRAYHIYADIAAAYRVRGTIWDDDWCGAGPYQGAPLRLWVNWDAEGDDNVNVNGEYVVIANDAGYAVSLSGWYLRLNSHLMYTFPYGTYIPAGGRLRLHAGRGVNRPPTDYYWGSAGALFANANTATGMGAGAYLLDPQGDFRAWSTYPCVVYCSDPLQGKLTIPAVHYTYDRWWDRSVLRGERIDFALAAGATARAALDNVIVKVGARSYRFPDGTYLDPGETLTLYVGADPGGRADRLHHFWAQPSLLPDAGGKVIVDNYRLVRVACSAYGTVRCP